MESCEEFHEPVGRPASWLVERSAARAGGQRTRLLTCSTLHFRVIKFSLKKEQRRHVSTRQLRE